MPQHHGWRVIRHLKNVVSKVEIIIGVRGMS
jgi:hypothetical protein